MTELDFGVAWDPGVIRSRSWDGWLAELHRLDLVERCRTAIARDQHDAAAANLKTWWELNALHAGLPALMLTGSRAERLLAAIMEREVFWRRALRTFA